MRLLPVPLAVLATLAAATPFAATATTSTQTVMFRVEYVKTRTVGSTVVEREEGTHTFALTGHRRVDREADGRRITEITIPAIAAADGVLFVIDHNLRVVRRAPLNFGTGNQASTLRSAGAPMRYLGEETRGPLTLHHSRVEVNGMVADLWDYRFPNPVVAGSSGITLAATWRSAAPGGTPELRETRIVGVAELTFAPNAFDAVPRGFRVEGAWVAPVR